MEEGDLSGGFGGGKAEEFSGDAGGSLTMVSVAGGD